MKRILLFVLTNVLVVTVLGIVASLFGVNRYLTGTGLNLTALLGYALVMGFGGAIISLLISKPMAKWTSGVKVIHQPANADEAALMLSRLSGQTHQVFTALALSDGRKIHRAVNRSKVVFDHLTADDIADYVATGEPMGKAGAYGIQGPAARFIKSIQGSYSGIMGLPLFETAGLLRSFGLRC